MTNKTRRKKRRENKGTERQDRRTNQYESLQATDNYQQHGQSWAQSNTLIRWLQIIDKQVMPWLLYSKQV
jgi:hypothetical protein